MIKINVKANANENSIVFDSNKNIYLVKVKENPDKNKANKAIVKLISKKFGRKCKIKSGLTSKNKYVEFID